MNINADGTQMVTSYGRLDESRAETEQGSPETLIYVWELTNTDELLQWTVENRFIRPLTVAECDQFGITDCAAGFQIPDGGDDTPIIVTPVPNTPDTEDTTESETQATEPTEDASESETQATEPANTGNAIVRNSRGGAINIRASDSTNASVVGSLQAGEEAVILGRSTRDTRWYQIRISGGQIGWVRNDVVTLQGDIGNVSDVIPPPVAQPNPTSVPNTSGSTGNTGSSNSSTNSSSGGTSQANLQITGMGFAPNPPQCLQPFTVQINVRNTGTQATSAQASVFVVDRHTASGTQNAQGSSVVPELAPSQDFVVTVNLTVSSFFAEEHQIVAQVDSASAVPESNEGDNSSAQSYVLGSGSC
jgi:uncharacterized protein YraI